METNYQEAMSRHIAGDRKAFDGFFPTEESYGFDNRSKLVRYLLSDEATQDMIFALRGVPDENGFETMVRTHRIEHALQAIDREGKPVLYDGINRENVEYARMKAHAYAHAVRSQAMVDRAGKQGI